MTSYIYDGENIIGLLHPSVTPHQAEQPFFGYSGPRPWLLKGHVHSMEPLEGKKLTIVLGNGTKMENCELISSASAWRIPGEMSEREFYHYTDALFYSTGPAKETS